MTRMKNFGWGITAGGVTMFLYMIANQLFTPYPAKATDFLMYMIVCPLPVLTIGVILLLLGSRRKSREEAQNTSRVVPTGVVKPAPTRRSAIPHAEEITQEASALIAASLEIIETQVRSEKGLIQMATGSDTKVMEAARQLEEAHKLHPQNPGLHYAWASALHLAAQFKLAEDEMKNVVQLHPDFLLAKFAVGGWARWKSPFTLPSWTPHTTSVPPAIAGTVKTTILLSVRDGLSPRATLFLRDVNGDFRDLKVLNSAKIDITSVISPVTTPQLIAIYAKIWDNPRSPYVVEELGAPLHLQGYPTRCTFEYLCLQQDIDFVILDNRSNILLNKRLTMPGKMRETNQQLLKLLESSTGQEISTSELVRAIQSHQRQMSPSNLSF